MCGSLLLAPLTPFIIIIVLYTIIIISILLLEPLPNSCVVPYCLHPHSCVVPCCLHPSSSPLPPPYSYVVPCCLHQGKIVYTTFIHNSYPHSCVVPCYLTYPPTPIMACLSPFFLSVYSPTLYYPSFNLNKCFNLRCPI